MNYIPPKIQNERSGVNYDVNSGCKLKHHVQCDRYIDLFSHFNNQVNLLASNDNQMSGFDSKRRGLEQVK